MGLTNTVVDNLTPEQILTELELVRNRRREILSQKLISESVQGRQTVWEGQAALDALDRHEKNLLSQLRRSQRHGIVVRTGVPMR